MEIKINIPDNFTDDYIGDKFKDFFSRVTADITGYGACGIYEKEIAEMFLKAFDESIEANNICNCQHNNNSRNSEPCCRCDSRKTNADRIRSMSDEELAANDYSAVLKEAKSMGCNEIRALCNIPLINMKLIVKALEKQIPKKLEIRNATNDDIESELRDFITTQGKICRCPTCKDNICISGIEYCWYCGQKLDWSEKE